MPQIMTSRDRPRDNRVIYKISDSRQHLVGPSRLGSLAALSGPASSNPYHRNQSLLEPSVHCPILSDVTTGDAVAHHVGLERQCSTSSAETAQTNDLFKGDDHPILHALINDSQMLAMDVNSRCGDFVAIRHSSNPSVLDLIPELQRSQSYYYTDHGTVGLASTWTDSFDWGFPAPGTSERWSGHLKSVLFDVLNSPADNTLPTILQPRFKKSPGASAALFVPSVMASIWRRYSDDTDTTGGAIGVGAPLTSLVTTNNRNECVSNSKTADWNSREKNAKSSSRSASVKRQRTSSPRRYHNNNNTTTTADRAGPTANIDQNDMAGGKLSRHPLVRHLLAGLKSRFKGKTRDIELRDMSSHLPADISSSQTSTSTCRTTNESDHEGSPDGEVTFFHYNADGAEYTCTYASIYPAAHVKPTRQLSESSENSYTNSSVSAVNLDCSIDSEDEEEVIEAVLINEMDHDNCSCTRTELDCESSVDPELTDLVDRQLSDEFSSTPNENGNCLVDDEDIIATKRTHWKRRTSSTLRRIPTILRKKKVRFAGKLPNNHKVNVRILGSYQEIKEKGKNKPHGPDPDKIHKRRWWKHKVQTQGGNTRPIGDVDDEYGDEPFEWPDDYIDVSVPPSRWTQPKSVSEMRRYVSVASGYVPTVYVKLYVQIPLGRTQELCELKSHLLTCIFRSFFTTTEGLYINWVMSLQSHVYNLLYMDVARVQFRRESSVRPCRACLLLSRDATVLVRHKRCGLLTTISDILRISPEELLVLQKGERADAKMAVTDEKKSLSISLDL